MHVSVAIVNFLNLKKKDLNFTLVCFSGEYKGQPSTALVN